MYNEGYFYNAIKRDIAMVKGDTMSFGFQIMGLGGREPDKITFSCKSEIEDEYCVFVVSNDDTIDLRSYDSENDIYTYSVRIPPKKTKKLELGRYFYDLSIEVDNDVITLMIGRLSIEFEVEGEEAPTPPEYDDGDTDLYPMVDIPSGLKKIYTVQYISNIASALNTVNGDSSTYDTYQMSGAVLELGNTITALNERIAELIAQIPAEIDDTVFPAVGG